MTQLSGRFRLGIVSEPEVLGQQAFVVFGLGYCDPRVSINIFTAWVEFAFALFVFSYYYKILRP